MKRLFPVLTTIAAMTVPHLASAQTYSVGGNNPTVPGIYVGLGLGFSILDDTDFDLSDFNDESAETDTGFYGDISVGYTLPQGQFSIRAEGELSVRVHEVDNFDDVDALKNSDISSVAGMLNGYVDYYLLPNMALSAGVGIGYANVQADIAVELNGEDTALFDEEDDNGFAYQGMLGGRYDFYGNSAVELGYTYFAVNDLNVDFDLGGDADFDYLSHAFHLGYSYRF